MLIYNDDKEFFRKCIEIWDKIIELIGTNNHIYFLKVLEYLQKTKTLKINFFLDQSFGIGLK